MCLCMQTVFALQSGEQVDRISASLGTYDVIAEPSSTKQYTLEAYSHEHFRLILLSFCVEHGMLFYSYYVYNVCIV